MEKYFANYNQSLALKELGFDEPCMGNYRLPANRLITEWEIKNTPEHCLGISAPLKQQVFRWFREKYNTNICISWRDDLLNYDISLTEMKKGGYFYYKENFNNYEEAESACIDKLIEIVKNR